MYRQKMHRKKDKKVFTKTASKTNSRNLLTSTPMRGGIRL